MSDYQIIRKDAHDRANKFFKSKVNSLNITVDKFADNYIEILKTHILLILDTETTGLRDDDKLWQISIRVIQNYKEIDHLYETFKPANEPELRTDDAQYARYKSIIDMDTIPLQKINNFIAKYSNSVIIAHNISFDVPHCEDECIIFPEDSYFFDTMWIITTDLVSLSKLCVFNNVDCQADQQHDASYDTRILRDCVVQWLQNYLTPIKFSSDKWLCCITAYLQDPVHYNSDAICNKKRMKLSSFCKKYGIPELSVEESINLLKSQGFTVKYMQEYVNLTESYYRVIVNKTSCYIEYNYTGEDIERPIDAEPFDMPQISNEQAAIVEAIADNNVTVDAVAGSGKTTTAMFIAQKYPNKRILLLTYNKQLQLDSQRKCSIFSNITVKTFHGFCGYMYGVVCRNDKMMYKLIKNSPIKPINYDIIIVDEAQDLIEVFYELIKVIDKHNTTKHTLMLVGDKYQNIYYFNGATTRYLVNPEKYFDRPFKHLTLQTSYRLTNQMSAWLNNDVMHQQRILTCKDGKPVTVVFSTNQYTSADVAAKYFGKKINELYQSGVDVNDIMIVCFSVRSRSMQNFIYKIKKQTTFDIYVPMSDDYVNKDCCKDKILFSSIHQSKGIERDYVFLLQFDTSYCYAFNEYLTELNNLFYVGLTRAKKELTVFIRDIVVNIDNETTIIEPFKFITFSDNSYVNYINKIETTPKLTEDMIDGKRHEYVTKLCKFIKASDEMKLSELIKIDTLQTKRINPDIHDTVNNEEVSDISGCAVTDVLAFRHIDSAENVIDKCKVIQSYLHRFANDTFTLNKLQKINVSNILGDVTKMSISQLLKLETFKDCEGDSSFGNLRGFIHRPLQLGKSGFNWINNNDLELMIKTTEDNFASNNLSLEGEYESLLIANLQELPTKKTLWHNDIEIDDIYKIADIRGRADLVTKDDDIVEFKVVSEIKISHICQALLYAFMHNKNTAILYNIRTGEMLRVSCDKEIEMMKILLNKYKYNGTVIDVDNYECEF